MSYDLMPFDLPTEKPSIIKVLGVGGGGSNAVNHMYRQGIKDVNFLICNTDSQALVNSPVPVKIQLGGSLTEGLGAGNKPENGRSAAIESIQTLIEALSDNTKMIFITAGMGGGTGTGAAPVIAKAAKEMGILTVGIVTIPFRFEGPRRINQAIEGISELSKNVDSLLVINNEKIREIYGDLPFSQAFSRADDVLTVAAKGIAEIITVHGYVNVDFADVQTVMSDSGVAIMGSGQASGENRAINAVKNALNSPLLNNSDIRGAKNILLNIVSGSDEITMDEVTIINEFVQEATGNCADLIWGNTKDDTLGENIAVTVIATGFETDIIPELYVKKKQSSKTVLTLDDEPKKKTPEDITFEVKRANEKNEVKKETLQQQTAVKNKLENEKEKEIERFSIDDDSDDDDDFFQLLGKKNVKKETDKEPVKKTEQKKDFVKEKVKEPEIFDEMEFELETDANAKKAVERMNELKKKMERNKENQFNINDYKNIDNLENVPAYIRKQLKIDFENHSKSSNISRYSLTDDDDGSKISSKNSYLHDNVD